MTALDEREALASLPQQDDRFVAIPLAGGMHIHVQQQAECVVRPMAKGAIPETMAVRLCESRYERGRHHM